MFIKTIIVAVALLFTPATFAGTATINGQDVVLQADQGLSVPVCTTLECAIMDARIDFISADNGKRYSVLSEDDAYAICDIARKKGMGENITIRILRAFNPINGSCVTY